MSNISNMSNMSNMSYDLPPHSASRISLHFWRISSSVQPWSSSSSQSAIVVWSVFPLLGSDRDSKRTKDQLKFIVHTLPIQSHQICLVHCYLDTFSPQPVHYVSAVHHAYQVHLVVPVHPVCLQQHSVPISLQQSSYAS